MYYVKPVGSEEIGEAFATPDAAYIYAKETSKAEGSSLQITSSHVEQRKTSSSIRAYAENGTLKSAVTCPDCKGKGKIASYYGTIQCSACGGSGVVAGKEFSP